MQTRRDSKYVKFQDGDMKTLRFDTTKPIIKSESRTYPGKINWDFTVYDTQVSEFDSKTWSASKDTAEHKVVPELKRGYTVLDIQRDGTGRDTRYIVRPVS